MAASKALAIVGLLIGVLLTGCLRDDSDLANLDLPVEIAPGITNVSGEIRFDHGTWAVGDWWHSKVKVDFGGGFYLEAEGKLVVTAAEKGVFTLATDNTDIGIIDGYFDSFYQGAFDGDLNPTVFGKRMKFYEWPMKAGLNWTTPWMPSQPFTFQPANATLHTEVFEDADPGAVPRLRVRGETDDGATIDYDFNPATGWMTYFRMVNTTTGRIALALDFGEAGRAYSGDLHRLLSEDVFLAFKMIPPFDPTFMTPTPDRFDVPSGFTFIEYIRFLGVYTLQGPAGAGAGVVTIIDPNGQADHTRVEGALEFKGEFERNHLEPYADGTYTVNYALAGTAFAFVLVKGFKDEAVRL